MKREREREREGGEEFQKAISKIQGGNDAE